MLEENLNYILDLLKDNTQISKYGIINFLVCYIAIIIIKEMVIIVANFFIGIIKWLIISMFYLLGEVFLGKKHEKSMEYKRSVLWYFKIRADVFYYLRFLHIPNEFLIFFHEMSDMELIRVFSLHSIIRGICSCVRGLFRITVFHVFSFLMTFYLYFYTEMKMIVEEFFSVNEFGKTEISFFMSIATLMILSMFAAFDITIKADAYAEIRKEYCKNIIKSEEELLSIFINLKDKLNKNIDIMLMHKEDLLLCGAKELSGKNCYIENNKLIIPDESTICFANRLAFCDELIDCKEDFDMLREQYKKIKGFGLQYYDLYKIDGEIFWQLSIDFNGIVRNESEYELLRCFSQERIKEWYQKWFNKDRCEYSYSKDRLKEKICEASCVLDYLIIDALLMDLCLDNYIRLLRKKFLRINIFSRLKIVG